MWDKSVGKEGLYARPDFIRDKISERYICPGGKQLTTTGTITTDNTILYHTRNPDCAGCERKAACRPNTPNRKIARSVHEEARDYARSLKSTPAYRQSRRDRKKVEMSFAPLKRILNLERLRLRGMTGANDELLLAATARNLRKMVTLIWKPPGNDSVTVPA